MKTDQELLTDFRNGDRPAFHKLIRRHHVAILNFFHPLTGSHAAAEELTQKTFLRIFGELEHQAESSLWGRRRADDPQPFSTFLTYLYRTGYVCWLEYLRREGLPGVLPMPAPITANTSPAIDGAEGADNPSKAIATLAILPNELKPLVVLSEISRLSYSDVAAVLNLSTSAVKLRLREAFGLLRNARREISTPVKAPAEERSVPPESAAPGAAKA